MIDDDDDHLDDAGWAHGCVFWTELNTHDPAKAKAFYEKTLGWEFEDMPMEGMTYWMIYSDMETVGGMFEMKEPHLAQVPDHWMTYISVDDVDVRVKAATEAGATVLRDAFDVPDVGRIVILKEPGGAVVGWMTPIG